MKKIIVIFVLFLCFPLNINAISAKSAVVMDADSHRVLYAKNSNKVMLIASITKIMTAMVAIESGKMDEIVIVDETIFESYGSGVYIEYGEELSLRQLVTGLLLRSGNDAALMIAAYVSGGEKEFVDEMNNLALKIGMKNTIFGNPHGLDETTKNYSTSYDMALLSSYAIKNPEYKKITGMKTIVVKTNKKTYEWNNKNKLLKTYKYAIGGKTGYTESAKRTLVTNAYKDNLSLTTVTLNDPNDFLDHQSLYEIYFEKYQNYLILNKKNFEVVDNNFYNKKLYIKNNFTYALTPEEKKRINITVELKNNLNKNKAGYAYVYFDDSLIQKETIYYKKEKKESLWTKVKKWLNYD